MTHCRLVWLSRFLDKVVQAPLRLVEFSLPFCLGLAMTPDFFERSERHLGTVATVECTEQPVIIPPRDRIVLVIMTPRAGQGHAEHRRAGRGNHVVEFVEAGADSLFLHQTV